MNHIDQEVDVVAVSAADVAEYQRGQRRDDLKVLQHEAQVESAGQEEEGEEEEEEDTQMELERVVPGKTKREFAAAVGNNNLPTMKLKDRKMCLQEKTLVV